MSLNIYAEVIRALKDYHRAKRRVEKAQQRLDTRRVSHIDDARDEREVADAPRAFDALCKPELAERLDALFG